MRATRLHATSLVSGAELPRNELIAALTPAKARALLYDWAFWAGPISCRPVESGGYGSCLRAVASERPEPVQK